MKLEELLTASGRDLDSAEARSLLTSPKTRAALLAMIHPLPQVGQGPLLRALLQSEVEYRRSLDQGSVVDEGDYFENIYWCAFLLAQVGELRDVLPLWRAKHTNFDVGCGFDAEALIGPGLQRTLDYLSSLSTSEAADASQYIEAASAHLTESDVQEWRAFRADYFGPRE